MENENLTENDNVEMNKSGAGEAAQLDLSNPIAGGIVSQMAIQEDVAQSGAGEQGISEAPAPAGGADSETAPGAEQEK
ncbi:MAG: hypothetical protein AB7U82_10170 [Blastocatellales bacterium]